MNNDLKYWVAFGKNTKIGFNKIQKLLAHFGSLDKAWNKGNLFQFKKAGIEEKLAEEISKMQKEISPDQELEKLEKLKIKVLTYRDKEYPRLLSEIYSPPPIIYFKGNLSSDDFTLAIVGTRKPQDYGKQVAFDIALNLAQNGVTIVSGLALGIDTIAHEAVLKVSGKTIAVLGCGLDYIYPTSNRRLADEIIQKNGALVSEFPQGTPPLHYNFPQRNRIISGLSLGVLIVEAPEESGALITAKFALEQNREVFAVPGNIYSKNSTGTNNLIKMGAKPVINFIDILDELNLNLAVEYTKVKKIVPENEIEERILKYLSKEAVHVDILIKDTGLDAATINSTLTLMEMKGIVRNLGGNS